MWIAATPDLDSSFIVLKKLNAPHQPVSISTRRDVLVAHIIHLTSSTTSPRPVMPKSGIPKEAFATPAPDK